MAMIEHITSNNFEQLVEKSSLPVVVDVYAAWCGPCQMMAPLFEELATQHAASYSFLKLDVDAERDVAVRFGIMSIPTFLFFKQGTLAGQEMGYMSKADLESKIKQHLG